LNDLKCIRVANSSFLQVALAAVIAAIIYGISSNKRKNNSNSSPLVDANGRLKVNLDKKTGRGNVDMAFWNKLSKLVKIVLPNFACREARYIYFLTILLIVRTLMSIWLADVNGRVVKAIVNKNFSDFLKKVSSPLRL